MLPTWLMKALGSQFTPLLSPGSAKTTSVGSCAPGRDVWLILSPAGSWQPVEQQQRETIG